jgi:predicted RNA-binding Zn-ribbon protein involved in translation (DUF1610 family)
MQDYLCESCNYRWRCDEHQTKYQTECPKCGEKFEIRKTMPKEEAVARGYEIE